MADLQSGQHAGLESGRFGFQRAPVSLSAQGPWASHENTLTLSPGAAKSTALLCSPKLKTLRCRANCYEHTLC